MPACFDDLPSELKSLVWSYVDLHYQKGSLISRAPCACVSREWQLAIEDFTFQELAFQSNQLNRFQEFREYVLAGNPIAILRRLHFQILIPNIRLRRSFSFVDDKIQADNVAFTKSIGHLWALLGIIEDGCPDPQALKLHLYLSAECSKNCHEDCFSRLNFAETPNPLQFEWTRRPEDLPLIPWIHGLHWSGDCRREIGGAALMKVGSRFTGLTVLRAFLRDHLRSTQVRSDLAQEMLRLSLPHLSELAFSLNLSFDFSRDEKAVHLREVSSSPSDTFSIAVHRLSQSPNLLKVNLGNPDKSCGVRITPELFWPRCEGLGGQRKPFWPNLRSLTVLISAVSPDGTALYTQPTDEVKSVRPIMTKVNPLFVAAARASQHMPQLLEMSVILNRAWHSQSPPCEMAFAAQNHCSEEDTHGYHAAVRVNEFTFPSSKKVVVRSCQLDLSKPRVSIIIPSECTIDSHLAQVWKASKGDVDFKVGSGFVFDDDDNDNDADGVDEDNDDDY